MDAVSHERAALTPPVDDEAVSVALRRLLAVTGASFEQRAQLEHALETRIVIEQAKGMLAERLRMRPTAAFELLRGTARSRQMRLHDLAHSVVESADTPAAIVAYLQKSLTDEVGEQNASRQREGAC